VCLPSHSERPFSARNNFNENIALAILIDPGQTLHATVTFYAVLDPDYPDQVTEIGTEQISIFVTEPVPGFSKWGIIVLIMLLGGALAWLFLRRQIHTRVH
jgi:hypothetical protein